jgi:hypothetical protein
MMRLVMKGKAYRDPHELGYGDFDALAAFLRTYVFADDGVSTDWPTLARMYAKNYPEHAAAVVEDLNRLLADPRATDDQVSLWLRVRTASNDGRLEPNVPVRHSLLTLRDLLYALQHTA